MCVVDLGFCHLPSLPQADGQFFGADPITLQLSEVLVQPVGPLAHGAHMQPQRICRTKSCLSLNCFYKGCPALGASDSENDTC